MTKTTAVDAPALELANVLKRIQAILGVHRVVEKQREIWLLDNVRIHLDRVAGLGSFVEIEAVFDGGPAAEAAEWLRVEALMRELGIAAADLIDGSYESLVEDRKPAKPARSEAKPSEDRSG